MNRKVRETQKVRFILAWQDYEFGEVAELPTEQVKVLVRRGIAEVEEESVIIKP